VFKVFHKQHYMTSTNSNGGSHSLSILLIRLSSLGDIILTTPLLQALRERFPDARIDLVIAKEYESLSSLLPGVSNVYCLDKAAGKPAFVMLKQTLATNTYDHVLDLHNVLRSRLLRRGFGGELAIIDKRTFKRWLLVKFKVDRLKNEPDVIGRYFETAASLGVKDSGAGPKLQVNAVRDRNRIAMAPGSRHWNKRWPTEYFIAVAKRLTAQGFHVDIHGSEADRNLAERIAKELHPGTFDNHTGKLNLAEVAIELKKATAIITNDSGLMHIAEAVGTKIIAIFGPTVKQFGFAPRDPHAVVLEIEGLHCRPCTAIGLDHCPEQHFRCMKEIEPDRVLHQLELMTSNESPEMKA
jgi:heptosyltransferase-2